MSPPKARVLWRRLFQFQRAHDRVVLRLCDQAIAQAAVGVRRIRIADAEREIKCALVIPGEDVEVAFRSPAIALPHFVALWTQAESDAIRFHQLVSIVEKQTAFSFLHDNSGRGER